MNLFEELQNAIQSGDTDRIERAKKMLLLENRDKSLDTNLIESVKSKTLGKNLSRIVEGVEFSDKEYMKILSSLFTHCIIESEKTGNSLEDYSIHEMYVLIGNFINNPTIAVSECKKFISERYGEFLVRS